MKKDKKFLTELENELTTKINKKQVEKIVEKYRKIIDEEIKNKKKITTILKELGSVSKIAKTEIEDYKRNNKKIKIFFEKIGTKIRKIKKNDKQEKFEIKKKKEKAYQSNKIKKIFSDLKNKLTIKNKKKSTITQEIQEVKKDIVEEVSVITEIVSEKKIFESKKDRIKRISINIICYIVLCLLLFIWLWISVVFVASLVAFLDGIRIIGINIALLGINLLFLWFIIIFNRYITRKKNKLKLNLIVIIICILLIALGIVLAINEIVKIDNVTDVSEKYSMTTKYDTYNLPSDDNMYLNFNSNYDTQYIVNFDDNLDNKMKLEVKYYECYYDYYVKKSTNDIYVSLKLDPRDRLSVYMDDLKEDKIYDSDELSRYIVKITISRKDYVRLIINN